MGDDALTGHVFLDIEREGDGFFAVAAEAADEALGLAEGEGSPGREWGLRREGGP